MIDLKTIVDKKIEEILLDKNNIGIVLVGSSKEKYILDEENSKNISDVDIFVIRSSGFFEREVIKENELDWDISYISIENIYMAIDKEISSLISVLATGYIIYGNSKVEGIIEKIIEKFNEGPREISDYNKEYIRFKITSKLELVKAKKNSDEVLLIIDDLLLEILDFYYRINRIWKPPIKKIIKKIEDKEIKYATMEILEETDIEKKIIKVCKLTNIVLKSLGGFKNIWIKGDYPFDFN